jgi:hypothetical protein
MLNINRPKSEGWKEESSLKHKTVSIEESRVGFKVIRALGCNLLKSSRRFGGVSLLKHIAKRPNCSCFLACLLFNPEDGGDIFLRNVD